MTPVVSCECRRPAASCRSGERNVSRPLRQHLNVGADLFTAKLFVSVWRFIQARGMRSNPTCAGSAFGVKLTGATILERSDHTEHAWRTAHERHGRNRRFHGRAGQGGCLLTGRAVAVTALDGCDNGASQHSDFHRAGDARRVARRACRRVASDISSLSRPVRHCARTCSGAGFCLRGKSSFAASRYPPPLPPRDSPTPRISRAHRAACSDLRRRHCRLRRAAIAPGGANFSKITSRNLNGAFRSGCAEVTAMPGGHFTTPGSVSTHERTKFGPILLRRSVVRQTICRWISARFRILRWRLDRGRKIRLRLDE